MEGGLPGESKDSSQGGLCPCPWGPVWGTCFPGRVLLTFLFSSVSDYVIDDKVAVLQKRDHEGFGFVLRGAKGNGAGYPAVKGCAPLGVSSVSCLCSFPLLSSCRAPAPLSSPPPASSPCCDSVFLVWDVGRRQRVLSLIGSQDLCCACLMERGPFWWGEWRGRGGVSQRGVSWIPGLALLALGSPRLPPPGPGRSWEVAVWQPPPPGPCWQDAVLIALFPSHSRDPHRGVHAHAGLPSASVSRVGGRGGRGLEGRAAHGGLPNRGEARPSLWGPVGCWPLSEPEEDSPGWPPGPDCPR